MSPTKDDRLAELCARHYLGEYGPRVSKRLEEIMSLPNGYEEAEAALLTACDHLGVTGAQLEEVVARLPEAKA